MQRFYDRRQSQEQFAEAYRLLRAKGLAGQLDFGEWKKQLTKPVIEAMSRAGILKNVGQEGFTDLQRAPINLMTPEVTGSQALPISLEGQKPELTDALQAFARALGFGIAPLAGGKIGKTIGKGIKAIQERKKNAFINTTR